MDGVWAESITDMGSCRRYRPSDKSRVNRDAMTQSHAHAPNADEWVGFVTDGVSSYKILKFRCQMAQCEVIRALTSDKFLVNSRQWGGGGVRGAAGPVPQGCFAWSAVWTPLFWDTAIAGTRSRYEFEFRNFTHAPAVISSSSSSSSSCWFIMKLTKCNLLYEST